MRVVLLNWVAKRSNKDKTPEPEAGGACYLAKICFKLAKIWNLKFLMLLFKRMWLKNQNNILRNMYMCFKMRATWEDVMCSKNGTQIWTLRGRQEKQNKRQAVITELETKVQQSKIQHLTSKTGWQQKGKK